MKNGHGAAGDNAQDKCEDGFFNSWSRIRHYLREPLAEWLGVCTHRTDCDDVPVDKIDLTIPSADNRCNDNRTMRNVIELHLIQSSRKLHLAKLSLGLRIYGSNLHHGWYIRRPPKPSLLNRNVCIPRLPRQKVHPIHSGATPRSYHGRWHRLRNLSRRNPRGCCCVKPSTERQCRCPSHDHITEIFRAPCYGVLHGVSWQCDLVRRYCCPW